MSPASSITITSGEPRQTFATMRLGKASRGSDSQTKSGRPGASVWRSALKLPCTGFSIQRKDDADDDVGDRPRAEREQPERRLAGRGLVERERQAQTEDEMPGQAPG